MAQIQLVAGELPPPACYATEQERLNAYVAAIIATITGGIQWVSQTTAPAGKTLYWLRTDADNRPVEALVWSTADGAWVRWRDEIISVGTGGGVVNAYTVTNTPAMAAAVAYRRGMTYIFQVAATNTGPVTVNVDGQGPVSVKLQDGTTDLVGGEWLNGQMVIITYDGANFQAMSPLANTGTHGSLFLTSAGAGNWVVPGGVYGAVVQCGGGGGGGNRANNTAKGGGGGGMCVKRWALVPGTSMAYVVGAAGLRGDAAADTNGGDTSFNVSQIAYGGTKGSGGGPGGGYAGADYGINGSAGTRAIEGFNTAGQFAGGECAFAGSQGGWVTSDVNASLPGTFGGGGAGDGDATDNASSNGGDGFILIQW